MSQAAQILVAFAAVAAFVWLIWSISERLTRRGVIVRPVSGMDWMMTKIERRHAEKTARKDVTAEE